MFCAGVMFCRYDGHGQRRFHVELNRDTGQEGRSPALLLKSPQNGGFQQIMEMGETEADEAAASKQKSARPDAARGRADEEPGHETLLPGSTKAPPPTAVFFVKKRCRAAFPASAIFRSAPRAVPHDAAVVFAVRGAFGGDAEHVGVFVKPQLFLQPVQRGAAQRFADQSHR